MLSSTGDVVGVEVLGWSQRTQAPAEVAVRIVGVADVLDDDDPLAQALLAGTNTSSVDVSGRPEHDGEPMRSMAR